jgi:MinD-like ATPase involved in chromosome partitioning or flagellar assembly
MTTITIHSFKGGTGKSLISVALAHSFSKDGEKVLLIDGDYGAPCLESFFPKKGDSKPFPEFLKAQAKLKEVVSETIFENLYVSYAPPPSFGEEIIRADVATHGRYLKRLNEGIDVAREKMGFDKIVIDNSSGITLPAINHLSCSDRSVIALRPVRYGVESTYDLIDTIYKKLRYVGSGSVRKDFIAWNQVPINKDDEIDPRVGDYLGKWTKKFSDSGISYGVTIPYISEVVTAMIADISQDLPALVHQIQTYVDDLKEKII